MALFCAWEELWQKTTPFAIKKRNRMQEEKNWNDASMGNCSFPNFSC